MRTFLLVRDEDVTGISGTGVVAEVVEFSSGRVVVHWLGERASIVVWDSFEDAQAIHGHGGKSRFVELPLGGSELKAESLCLTSSPGPLSASREGERMVRGVTRGMDRI